MTTHLILVGGFLGAGKTTLLLAAARLLQARGYRVGLVTNDQGHDLVDTAFLRHNRLAVSEVVGGCFCCRFDDLLAVLQPAPDAQPPDVILAEPVGSCTDLTATVLRPLYKQAPDRFVLAPLTVLSDVERSLDGFSPDVAYLYNRQLAEAEIILLSKADRVGEADLHSRLDALRRQYPAADIQAISNTTGMGVTEWLDRVLSRETSLKVALDIDYARYAEAEAGLGWLNARGTLTSARLFDPATWMASALDALSAAFRDRQIPIAHLKLQAVTPRSSWKASLVETGGPITWDTPRASDSTQNAEFNLNVRAHTTPAALADLVRRVLEQEQDAVRSHLERLECFSPAPPQPTFRLRLEHIEVRT